ncbi:MAG: Bax inhibitor-1/YccA family protein [Erysipelotrichia bacterium]|nr:Bax inhibitor-1/YccA family protein [Erysipelotrichia bacterium]
MSEYRDSNAYTSAADTFKNYLTKVFTKMGIALVITAVTAFAVYYNIMSGGIMLQLLGSTFAVIALFAVQIGLCIYMSTHLAKMSQTTCSTLFYAYAVITGITFSTLFLVYDLGTIFIAFAFTAVMFFACAVIGHTTNADLSKFSGLLIGGLIAVALASVLSLFIPVLRDSLLISYIGIFVFLGLTAWDVQKLKTFYYQTGGDGVLQGNLAVYGAFQLYLDFINIFLYVLRILGRNSSND